MKNKTVKKIASIVAIVLVISFFSSYIIYHLVNQANTEIKTEFALKETVYKTIDTKCFVIRDEEYIKNDAVGTSVSFVNDGERVATGDTVSVVFNSSEDAALYWSKEEGSLADVIDKCDAMSAEQREDMGRKAKQRIIDEYSWEYICKKYERLLVDAEYNTDFID